MLISGFTFIRNAKKFDFPILECVESMLPIVDELVINVGRSEDGTEGLVSSLQSPKIKVLNSVWDDSKTDKGLVLSEQTNIALDACQGRWALYLQADEALHESEHRLIRNAVEHADRDDPSLDGFRFRYLHFYGGYSLIQRPWNWYPCELRLINRASGARSFGDAQGFRAPNRALRTRLLDAHVYHYGHARAPEVMTRKIHYFHRFWHGDQHDIKVQNAYNLKIKDLVWYWGTHPAPYQKKVTEATWSPTPKTFARHQLQHIVVLSDKNNAALSLELKALLEQKQPNIKVTTVKNFKGWIRVFFSGRFRRRAQAVIDLNADTRSWFGFALWSLDAFFAFGTRIAHVPTGRLGRWRAFAYTAISWGRHEKTEQGFVVPSQEYAKQLARWIDLNP